ncbi:MAG TPA: chitobiase/beta-hexosaminidase C-terminal domain-containing protein, partial [Deferrisomatales bacterium]|nr:chitobiase/beta-hexosaminidase C-terminal domain-containing protein [Deferrisomatales bacterium]
MTPRAGIGAGGRELAMGVFVKKVLCWGAAGVLLLGLVGCGGGGGGSEPEGVGRIVVRLPAPTARAAAALLPAEITRARVRCSGPDMAEVSAELPLDGSAVELVVPAGLNRQVVVDAYAGDILRMSGSSTVASLSAGTRVSVTITLVDVATLVLQPAAVAVQIGTTRQFTAVVTGHADAGVTWEVVEADPAWGEVDASGLYKAPLALPDPPTATVRATSTADSTLFAEAAVTLSEGLVDTVPPTAAVSLPGGTYAPFSLTLTAADDTDPAPQIYYTFDDRPQGLDWFRYQTAIYLLSGTQTIRFFAVDAAGNWSAVRSETYTIEVVTVGVTIVPGAP